MFDLKKPFMIDVRERDLFRIRSHILLLSEKIKGQIREPERKKVPTWEELLKLLQWTEEYLYRISEIIYVTYLYPLEL